MTRSFPASAVSTLPQGAALTEEMGFNKDMKMKVLSLRTDRAMRRSGQPGKAGGSYALEEKGRAGVAGSGQVGKSKSET